MGVESESQEPAMQTVDAVVITAKKLELMPIAYDPEDLKESATHFSRTSDILVPLRYGDRWPAPVPVFFAAHKQRISKPLASPTRKEKALQILKNGRDLLGVVVNVAKALVDNKTKSHL